MENKGGVGGEWKEWGRGGGAGREEGKGRDGGRKVPPEGGGSRQEGTASQQQVVSCPLVSRLIRRRRSICN